MRGRLLLAILLSVTAWATLAQLLQPSAAVAHAAHISAETEARRPGSTGDSDTRWGAGDRASVSVTESLWKSSVVHAQLAGTPSGNVFVETDVSPRRDRPAHYRSSHLIHIPLLI